MLMGADLITLARTPAGGGGQGTDVPENFTVADDTLARRRFDAIVV